MSTLLAGAARGGPVRAARAASRSRSLGVSLVLAVLSFAALCLSVSVGQFTMPLTDVVPALFGHGDPATAFVVSSLRLPRALTGAGVGIAFGLSGALFQTLARNPLASPDIIGITAGASAAAVAMIVLLGAGAVMVSFGALAGAALTALTVYLLAYRHGVSAYRLVLVGIGIGAALSAVTSWILTRAEIDDAQRAVFWLTGSLNARGWEHVGPVWAVVAVLTPLSLMLARPLRALTLGDDNARALGARVEQSRALVLACGVGLAAVATAAAGPVAFVAFVSPAIARRLTGTPLPLLPSALIGVVLMLVADLIGRLVFAPVELPVGIVTGIVGAPYLLWLLSRANRIGQGG